VFFQARSGSYLHEPSADWSEAYRQQLQQAVRWPQPNGAQIAR
jgi:hypothetical protein